jgi:hypothetical protein
MSEKTLFINFKLILFSDIYVHCAFFVSGVSREPYKSLVALVADFVANFVANSVANFEACDWSMRFMQVILLNPHWLTILRPGWRQLAYTVLYKQLTTCTQSVQFCSARPKPILQKKIRICLIFKPLLMPGSSVQVHADWCDIAPYKSTTGPSIMCAPQVSTKML